MASKTDELLRREKMDTSLATLIDLFAATKRTEGKTDKTISWYTAFLLQFLAFVGEAASIADFSLPNARAFVAHLQSRDTRFENHPKSPAKEGGLSPYTIHGYVRTLKSFSSWLVEEGFTQSNVLAKLKRPKLPQPLIEILSDNEINQLVAAINPNCFLGARLYAIVLILLDTGIRASELCSLTLDNTYLNEGYLQVTGKGRKTRMVPFSAGTKKAILRYVTTFRPEPREGVGELILTADGTGLSYAGLLQIIRRLGKRAGVPRLHPHLFRHSFAVKYLMNGGDVMTLKLILGHTTLDVTQVYMHLASSHIQIQHSKFSPVEAMGIGVRRRKSALRP